MNIKKLIEKISDNWAAKIICFALAIFIYIFHQVALLDKKTFSVPLKVESEGLLTPSSQIPPYVKVSVRTKSDSISAVSSAGIKAYLYLEEYTEPGIYSVPVSLKLSSDLMLVEPLEISVKPEILRVELDEKIQKYIPVEPSVSGEVEKGYKISAMEVVPSTVKVVGPSRIVNKMKRVYTAKVNVKGAATGFMQEVSLDDVNHLVKPLPESAFKVTVVVEPEQGEMKFENVTPSIVNLNPLFLVENTVPAVTFTVGGTVPVLDKIKPDDVSVCIDCISVEAPGVYELPVVYSVQPPLSVTEKSLETVSVTVIEASVMQEETEVEKDASAEAEADGENAKGREDEAAELQEERR